MKKFMEEFLINMNLLHFNLDIIGPFHILKGWLINSPHFVKSIPYSALCVSFQYFVSMLQTY